MPAISPCSTQPRGSRDGVSELQPKRIAPSVPLHVYVGSHRHGRRVRHPLPVPAATGGGDGDGSGSAVPSGVVVVGCAVIARLRSSPRRQRSPRGTPRDSYRRGEPVRRSRPHDRRMDPAVHSTAPDVGLVVAAATAPGTFAPSLSPRSALDQGLVTGLSTGLHYLLAVEAQEVLEATPRFLVGGTASPSARPAATI